ncbi:hypothetical protein CYLTODRAFT_481021, partial [Cylindrobasidium torrendii FP15055 ss-10]
MTETFYTGLTEAQGIRSSLFGPIVRKEAVQGMLLLAALRLGYQAVTLFAWHWTSDYTMLS